MNAPKRKPIPKSLRAEIHAKCGGRCAYCGVKITIREMQIDHVTSLELYEAYTYHTDMEGTNPNCPENLLPACRSCNHYKNTYTIEQFRTAIMNWPYVLARDSVTYRNAVRFGLVVPKPHEVEFYFEQIGVDVPETLISPLHERHFKTKGADPKCGRDLEDSRG